MEWPLRPALAALVAIGLTITQFHHHHQHQLPYVCPSYFAYGS